MMKRIFIGSILGLLFACAGCAERTVTLDDGLKNTQEGKYSLVVVGDGLISFQIDAYHKYQYYGDAKSIAEAMPLLDNAMSVSSNSGHAVVFMDFRNNGSNQPARRASPRLTGNVRSMR
jgi:hypothetical protein